jgi:hypothetical protein
VDAAAYTRALRRLLLETPLTADEWAILEYGRTEARMPPGRYPWPSPDDAAWEAHVLTERTERG